MLKRHSRWVVLFPAATIVSLAVAGGIAYAGGQGAQGPVGEAHYAASRSMSLQLPTTDTALVSLTLPAGSWALTGTVLLNNFSGSRAPVVCHINTVSGSGAVTKFTFSAVGLAPYGSSPGGDAATLPVTAVTTITAKTEVAELRCVSNTGPGGAKATAEMPSLLATRLAQLNIQLDPDQN